MKKTILLICFLIGIIISCQTEKSSSPRIQIENVWSRPAHAAADSLKKMGTTGVVYLTILNQGGASDRLLSASTDAAEVVELHQTIIENDRMSMQMVKNGLEIPAKGKIEFKPGGHHIMLIGLNHDLNMGDKFEVRLQFEKSGQKQVESEVRNP